MTPKSSLIFNEQHKTAKKRNRKYIIAALITGIILVAALGIRISVMTKICKETVLPENLTAEETVLKMVDYWNDGSQKGLYLICDEDFTLSEYGYDLTPYYFTQDIAYTKINEINELDNYSDECYNDRNYADIQFFTLRYRTYLSFDNVGWRENGFAIVIVAKESEDSPWKIHAMYSGG